MKDLIERQAAIDEIEYELEMINSALDSITLDFNTRERLRQRRGEAREILNSIQQLPSAQPDLCDGCDRYGASCVGEGCGKLEVPKIIRCRDCISYQEGIDIDGKPFTRCNGSVRTYGHTPPDWYCADAERRTDGTEQP